MWLRTSAFLWLWALRFVLALEESEAGVIDWHKELVGVPLTHSPKSLPGFIRSDPSSPAKKTGIAVVTKSNVLAVLNPGSTGNIVWRRQLDQSEGRILQYKTHRDALLSISGPGGSHVRLFESFTGNLLWERQLHLPSLGRLLEPENLGVDVAFWNELSDIDAYVLTNGHTPLVDWKDGQERLFGRGIRMTQAFSYHASFSHRHPSMPPTNRYSPLPTTDLITNYTWDARCIRIQHARHESASCGFDRKQGVDPYQVCKVHDVQLEQHGLFVVETKDELPYVFGTHSTGLKQEWDFDDSAVSRSETPSLFSGSVDREGNAYIARVFWSHTTGLANIHTYAAHGSEGKGISTGATFPFNTAEHGCAVDAFMPHSYSIQHRMFLTTSTGAVQLWQLQDFQWTRDEALAEIRVAGLVDLPERKIAEEIATSEHCGFAERLIFHMIVAQNLPQYISQFTKRFTTGSYASLTSATSSSLERDPFGFRKILVVATNYGTLLGIDTAQGTIVWRKIIGVSSTGPADVTPFKLFVTKSALEGPDPEVVLVAEKKLRGKKTVTSVVFHFEALTGRWVTGGPSGIQVASAEVAEAFLLPGTSNTVGVVSTDGKVHIYPNTRPTINEAPQLYFTRAIGSELRGYSIDPKLSTPIVETWKKAFTTPAMFPDTSASHLEVIHRPVSPIASYGKVLGVRTMLYKYLNPNAAAVLAPDCAARVVDLVSGVIVFDSGALPAPCEPPKGTKVVSVELYERHRNDDKTNSIETLSFSERSSRLHVVQQSFLFPYPVVALGATATKLRISTKGLLLATSKSQIYHIHCHVLDPRRPLQKPTAQDQEEMLFQYEPVLPPDTRHIITHKNQVLGTKNLVAAPTLLELTSCMLAYGLDLFHT
ncbi:hypothetical protein OPQ81_006185 [Rhizoctonia solani]|nr:hypothetical protein OPQ81_006185 [Rhizoctonia solani]